MLNLILIDDDAFNIEYLERLIPWGDFGFAGPVCFTDSEKAMEYLAENSVDAVITDIKMPVHTGIDIAKYCEKISPKTKIVLLSAYREFEYARMAIQLKNIIDYVQKPIDYDEFSERLKTLAEACMTDDKKEFITSEQMNQSVKFFTELFYGQIKDMEQIKAEVKKLGVSGDIDSMKCTHLTFYINEFSEYLLKVWKHDASRIYYAITKMYSPETDDGFFFLSDYSFNKLGWVIMHKNPGAEEVAKEFCDTFVNRAKSLLSLDITVKSVKTMDSLEAFVNRDSEILDAHNTHDVDNKIIESVYEYMQENYDKDISLGEAAEYVHVSQSYLSLYFKKVTKKNFIDCLTEIRMKNAIKLLNETSYSIERICDMVGYKNLSHFRNVFKRYFGITPAKYRKQGKSSGE